MTSKHLIFTALCALLVFSSCRNKCTCTYIDPYTGLQHTETAWVEGGAGVTKSSSTSRCHYTELEYIQMYDNADCVMTTEKF